MTSVFLCHALRIGDSLGISADSRAIYVRAVPLLAAFSVFGKKTRKKLVTLVTSEIDCDSASNYDECSKCCPQVILQLFGPHWQWLCHGCPGNQRSALVATGVLNIPACEQNLLKPFDVLLIGVHRSDHILVTALGVLMASSALLFLPEEAGAAMRSCGL